MCKKVNQRKIFSQNLTMNKVWISGQLVCGAYFVLFQEKRKIVHIHISVHANFYLNWLSVTLIITFLRFKINFLYCSTLSSSNFTTWGELLALKPRTVNNLLNLLSEWDLFFFFPLRSNETKYEGHSDRNRTSAITLLWNEIIQSFKRQNSSTGDFRLDGAS